MIATAPEYELVRQRLIRTRRQLGLNLRDAATAIGVSAPTLSRIERGTSKPDVPTLNALIDWLGLDAAAVYRTVDNRDPVTRSTAEAVRQLLAADPNLDSRAAKYLAELFEVAYSGITKA